MQNNTNMEVHNHNKITKVYNIKNIYKDNKAKIKNKLIKSLKRKNAYLAPNQRVKLNKEKSTKMQKPMLKVNKLNKEVETKENKKSIKEDITVESAKAIKSRQKNTYEESTKKNGINNKDMQIKSKEQNYQVVTMRRYLILMAISIIKGFKIIPYSPLFICATMSQNWFTQSSSNKISRSSTQPSYKSKTWLKLKRKIIKWAIRYSPSHFLLLNPFTRWNIKQIMNIFFRNFFSSLQQNKKTRYQVKITTNKTNAKALIKKISWAQKKRRKQITKTTRTFTWIRKLIGSIATKVKKFIWPTSTEVKETHFNHEFDKLEQLTDVFVKDDSELTEGYNVVDADFKDPINVRVDKNLPKENGLWSSLSSKRNTNISTILKEGKSFRKRPKEVSEMQINEEIRKFKEYTFHIPLLIKSLFGDNTVRSGDRFRTVSTTMKPAGVDNTCKTIGFLVHFIVMLHPQMAVLISSQLFPSGKSTVSYPSKDTTTNEIFKVGFYYQIDIKSNHTVRCSLYRSQGNCKYCRPIKIKKAGYSEE